MRIGLIARADSRGLGVQTKAFYDQMRPAKTLVVDCPSMQPLPIRRDWYPDGTWVHGIPSLNNLVAFCDGLDVIYTAETGYNRDLWSVAEGHGVPTVLAANFEFLDRSDRPTVWAAPSLWNINQWPDGTIHLPVPIELERFTLTEPSETATRLLHIVGRPTVDGSTDLYRNGTIDLLLSLEHVTATVTVTIRCQQDGYVGKLIADNNIRTPNNVTLRIESGDTPNYWDNYTNQDALILPRRFGGLCLPANEALGAGIPVIMPDINPNNLWLPAEWLVPATYVGEFRAKQQIQTWRTYPAQLAAKIDQLASDADFYALALTKVQRLRDSLSWNTLRPKYEQVLAG